MSNYERVKLEMAVDLTTGSYDEDGIFSKHDNSELTEKCNVDDNYCSLKNFRSVRILKESLHEKLLVVEGRFIGDNRNAIIVVEKMPFNVNDLCRLFTDETRLELKFRNNIYASYHAYPQNGFNGIDITVIHPAKDEDYAKYTSESLVMVNESIKLYESVVLPHFKTISSEQSYKGIIDANSGEKVIYKGEDSSTEFVLLKDDSEDCSSPDEHVHTVCVIQQGGLLALRDLTADNIPLLVKVKEKCLEILSSKYGVSPSKLESYIRYPPSHFPLHIFFVSAEKDAPMPTERAHELNTIISNLELIPDYYKKISLTYSLSEKDPLIKKIKDMKAKSNCNKESGSV